MKPPTVKSQKQVAFLLSVVSPLTAKQQTKFEKELHAHKVLVKPSKPTK